MNIAGTIQNGTEQYVSRPQTIAQDKRLYRRQFLGQRIETRVLLESPSHSDDQFNVLLVSYGKFARKDGNYMPELSSPAATIKKILEANASSKIEKKISDADANSNEPYSAVYGLELVIDPYIKLINANKLSLETITSSLEAIARQLDRAGLTLVVQQYEKDHKTLLVHADSKVFKEMERWFKIAKLLLDHAETDKAFKQEFQNQLRKLTDSRAADTHAAALPEFYYVNELANGEIEVRHGMPGDSPANTMSSTPWQKMLNSQLKSLSE